MRNNYLHILILIAATTIRLSGQEVAYKESKIIERTVDCPDNATLVLSGERTFLQVTTWDQDYLDAKIQVISKYTDKTQALADLEKVNVVLEKKGRKIIYSNALQLKSQADKPKSNLSVSVKLFVPAGIAIELTNAFGNIKLDGVYRSIDCNTTFTPIEVSGEASTLDVESKYGDIKVASFNGEIYLEANRSNVLLQETTGSIGVSAEYGEIDIYHPPNGAYYDISSKYCPITLYLPPQLSSTIDLYCRDCSLVDKQGQIPLSTTEKDKTQHGLLQGSNTSKESSTIRSLIEDIKIETYAPAISNK